MRIIGLTGGIGAGKSTVSSMLAARGATVVDVDALGREVLMPGGAAESSVIARFGRGVTDADGHIDRAALARVVFSDPAALAALEAISHPAINAVLDRRLDAADPDGVVVLDMAILLGSRLGRDLPSGRAYQSVVVVETAEAVRIQRLVDQRGMTEADARARIAAQPTDEARRAVATFVVRNDDGRSALERAVAALAHRLGLDGSVLVRASGLEWDRPWRASRPILPATGAGWDGVVLGEWALRGGWLADAHPHDELTYVVEGELTVTVRRTTHVLAAGDSLLVPGGSTARYEAPDFARMVFVYGPNPTGQPTTEVAEGPSAS